MLLNAVPVVIGVTVLFAASFGDASGRTLETDQIIKDAEDVQKALCPALA